MTWRDAARLWCVRLFDSVKRALVDALRVLLFKAEALPPEDGSLRRILLLRIGNVGDVVTAVPTLQAIRARFPKAYICLLTSPGASNVPGAKELIRPGKTVDSVIVYYNTDISSWTARARMVRRLRREGFDMFVELSNVIAPFKQVLQSMALARLAGCRYATGFHVAGSRRFARVQALQGQFSQECDRVYESLACKLNLNGNGSGRLPVSDNDRAAMNEVLVAKGVSPNEPLVILHVGAKRLTNRWFVDRYAAVADFVQVSCAMRVVLTGSPTDRDLVEQVRSQMRSHPVVVCGELELLQMAALLERARLYVGNDTGPMHIAAAMGTPTVAIFSARDFPRQWYPWGIGHIVLRRDVPCSPCFKEVCDRGLICLERIQVDDVIAAVRVQLRRGEVSEAGPPMIQIRPSMIHTH